MLLFVSGIYVFTNSEKICAEDNSNVKITVENGTLTVTGKGAIPKYLQVEERAKVEKIVIKKGITKIPRDTFYEYENLKEVYVANSVKSIGEDAFGYCKQLKKITLPGKFKLKKYWVKEESSSTIFDDYAVETVSFNTNLDLDVLNHMHCENYEVLASDPNYKSIDGVIYSKNGKDIVRVPFGKENVNIAEGTENFCLYSIFHTSEEWDGRLIFRCKVKQITLPSTLKKVEMKKYKPLYYDKDLGELELTIHSKKLNGKNLAFLHHQLNYGNNREENNKLIKSMAEQLPKQISLTEDMYITNDGVLLEYVGKGGEITVPNNVKVIGDGAFYEKTTLKKVMLPKGLKEIGEEAFAECYGWNDDGDETEWEINIPATVKKIGNSAFYYSNVKAITLPKKLKSLGESAFAYTKIKTLTIPNTIKKIPEDLCGGCESLKRVKFSKKVKVIGEDAFRSCPLKTFSLSKFKSLRKVGRRAFDKVKWSTLTLPTSLKEAGNRAFAKAKKIVIPKKCTGISTKCGGFSKTVFQYNTSPKNWKTSLYFKDTVVADMWTEDWAVVKLKWNKLYLPEQYEKIGYEIIISEDAKGKVKLNLLTITKEKNSAKADITLDDKTSKIYGKIRPFVIENGKRIYGKWSKVAVNS